jgi:sensor histidine kinase YesM
LAVYSFFNILFTGGDKLFSFSLNRYYLLAVILVMVLLVWESNRWLFSFLQHNQSGLKSRINLLILFFILSIVSVIIISAGVAFLVPRGLGLENTDVGMQFRLSLAFTFRINLFLHTIHAIMYYDARLKNTMLEAEKLKTLSAESQYEALRNQVKPHFLFNSFNVLSGLVHKNPGMAADFIRQLSKVYRYLLYHQEEKLVRLGMEIDFLQSYIFLLKIRFGDALKVQVDIPEDLAEAYLLPPASLQLLVENAVKHNVLTQKKPLTINIFTEERFLVIRNSLQRKKNDESKTGLGINNIRLRYRMLSKQEILVEEDPAFFTVNLPLIKMTADESINR